MAGGGGGRSLEETPTWAVAVVCFILVLISIFIEHLIHLIGRWLKKKQKTALYEALEKIKSELMLLGFVSLLLTVGQVPISNICVSKSIGSTWHPCKKREEVQLDIEDRRRRRRLFSAAAAAFPGGVRRELAAADGDNCVAKGKVALVSTDGIHQLHIFIFVLAVFHVIYSILTMALGRLKMRRWKQWEKETRTIEYQFSHDPERFRLARDTSFGRRHLSFGTKTPPLLYILAQPSSQRQFARSVPKVDYLTLRNGFIKAHLAGESQTKFDFQKYIKRSLEEDFKEVVGISPPIWLFAVFFLLLNTHGWYSYMWLPFIPLIIIMVVGTKLQVIITKMGLRFEASGGDQVVKGVPVVEPDDHLFWFNRPSLLLYLINFVLFQNAFQLAFFVWTWYEFGIKSCFNDNTANMVIRITMGIFVQILCSYVTLPLYALVTQMGSSMKTTMFNEQVAAALRSWHQTARKNIIKRSKSTSSSSSTFVHPIITPSRSLSPSPSPSHHLLPLHLLNHHHHHCSDTMVDGLQLSPSIRSDNCVGVESDDQSPSMPASPSYHCGEASTSYHHESDHHQADELGSDESSFRSQHVVDIEKKEFSFGRKTTT